MHTESFAALIPRKWNFTPNPKQTRPHISLHYLNELFEYKKSYQVDIQCTLPCVFRKSYLLIQENKKKSELCESLCLPGGHSRGISGSAQLKEVCHLAREVSFRDFSPDHKYSTHRANTQLTLCNPIFITNPFPPCQVGGLSILPSHIKFPLSPRSQLLSNHRSCALLISISCRFHFPRQRQREIKRRWVRGGTNTLTHHPWGGVTTYYHLQPCCTDKRKDSAHELVHTLFHNNSAPTSGWRKYKLSAGWCFTKF